MKPLHEKFIKDLFVMRDKPLQDAEFRKNIGLEKNRWIFDASQIRTRLAQTANIESKHIESQEQYLKRLNELMKANEDHALKMKKQFDEEEAERKKEAEIIKSYNMKLKRQISDAKG